MKLYPAPVNITIFSGDLNGNDGFGFVRIAENSHHVLKATGTTLGTILDGFVISGGNADYVGDLLLGGGGLFILQGSATVRGCLFTANSATTFIGAGGLGSGSTIVLANSVLWGNRRGALGDESAQIGLDGSVGIINYNLIENLTGNLGGAGNIDGDPLFIDDDGLDDVFGTIDGNLRLTSGSQCIDAADNSSVPSDEFDSDEDGDTSEPIPFDLDSGPRFVDDPDTPDTGQGQAPIVDMGAYEVDAMSLSDPVPGLAGGLNLWRTDGATPEHSVYFVYGLRTGSVNVPGCPPGTTVLIRNPTIFGREVADEFGIAVVKAFVPAAASGRSVRFQAVDQEACMVSNLVLFTFP